MKKILGFDYLLVSKCEKCGALFSFSIDDIQKININHKDKYYLDCPNCSEMCKMFINFTVDGAELNYFK